MNSKTVQWLSTCCSLAMLAAVAAPLGTFAAQDSVPELKGAYYCRLNSGQSWEQFAKVGPDADVKLRFENPADSLIFWRASSYLPLWQTGTGEWYFDEVIPRKGDGSGLRTDNICQMSHVSIVENTPARAIVVWRYLPDFSHTNLQDWAVETFTVYPDGMCVRAVRKGTPTLKEWEDRAHTIVERRLLTDAGIVPAPKSKENRGVLVLASGSSDSYLNQGFDAARGCYDLQCKTNDRPSLLSFTLKGGDGEEIHNPALTVKGWGDAKVAITLDGREFSAFRSGCVPNLNGADLVVWMKLESEKPVEITLTPVGGSPPIVRAPVPDPYSYKVPVLPEGSADPGPFGAYYTHLKYFPEWDEPWRVSDYPDIVVQFDDATYRFVFWRGTSYVPHWVNDQNHWYDNEFVERRPGDAGLRHGHTCEPMEDYDCRYSYAQIISANDARVVIHWRYAPCDQFYRHPFVDDTGWGDWIDEYYTVYPDAVCVRKATLYTSRPDRFNEWHEAIPIINPGCIPDDCLDMNAVSMTDYNGNKKVYNYEHGFPRKLDNLPIMLVGLKGRTKPFVIPEAQYCVVDETSHPDDTRFNQYDDWPAWPASKRGGDWHRDPANGNYKNYSKTLPAQSSLMHYDWADYSQDNGLVRSKTKILLNGMTANNDVNALIPLAKSWERPPALRLSTPGFHGGSYDKSQRAYRITRLEWWWPAPNKSSGLAPGIVKLEFTLEGSADSPVINPCFVIRNWPNEARARLTIDGQTIQAGAQFRQGIEKTVDGVTSLVIWVRKEGTSPVTFTMTSDRPANGQEYPGQ